MLCSGLNVFGMNWISSPTATELESVVMNWMAKMLKLPEVFLFSGSRQGGGGVLHGSTCEAAVCTLAEPPQDGALDRIGHDGITKFVVNASDQTHFTFQKASKIIGIPPCNFRSISTTATSGYALKPCSVRSAMEADVSVGLVPLYLCGSIGSTTAVGAVDPLLELGKVTDAFGVWFHVDAAHAGSAGICPEFGHYFDGVELADSISMNPHKWFLADMDCCCLWLKNTNALVQSLSTKPEILRNEGMDKNMVIDYKDWQIVLSRRFRAIKLWMIMERYGVENLAEHIRSDVAMAKHLEELVRSDERFEMVVPRRFSLVCFRLRPRHESDTDGAAINAKLLEAVNTSGLAFMTQGGWWAASSFFGSPSEQPC